MVDGGTASEPNTSTAQGLQWALSGLKVILDENEGLVSSASSRVMASYAAPSPQPCARSYEYIFLPSSNQPTSPSQRFLWDSERRLGRNLISAILRSNRVWESHWRRMIWSQGMFRRGVATVLLPGLVGALKHRLHRGQSPEKPLDGTEKQSWWNCAKILTQSCDGIVSCILNRSMPDNAIDKIDKSG